MPPSVRMSACLSVCLSVCLCVCLSVRLVVSLSLSPPPSRFSCLDLCVSVFLSERQKDRERGIPPFPSPNVVGGGGGGNNSNVHPPFRMSVSQSVYWLPVRPFVSLSLSLSVSALVSAFLPL